MLAAALLCFALTPPTVIERSCKFKANGMVRDRLLHTWGGNVTQSQEAYRERRHLVPAPLREWFDDWLESAGDRMLAFILGFVDGKITKIYFYDKSTGIHHGKELGHDSVRRYDHVNYHSYSEVPVMFMAHLDDTGGRGRIRYEVRADGSEYRQSFHMTFSHTGLRVRDWRRQLYEIMKVRNCDIKAFERWYQDHMHDWLTCVGLETESEAVNVYHSDDPFYD
jgi:hypothetical protein